jgi:hypothetical protein
MKKQLAQATAILSFIFMAGCQVPGIILRENNIGLSEARKAVVSVIGAPRSVSSNGRELVSKYYDKTKMFIEEVEKVKHRYYTKVTILGDRRPYDIAVLVIYESRIDGIYEVEHQDDGLATEVAKKIKLALNQSRDQRNVIDDFRSF